MNSPLPRTGLTKRFEASPMRSARDSGAVGQSWKGENKSNAQLNGVVNTLSTMKRQMEGMRRRILGGGGNFGTINGHERGEYISTGVYLTDDQVQVASGANAGSYACVKDHPPSTIPPWIGGGYWIKKADAGNGRWM